MSRRLSWGLMLLALSLLLLFSGLQLDDAAADSSAPTPEEQAAGGMFVPDMIEVRSSLGDDTTALEPAATLMSQNFEGAWPASGWSLEDHGASDGGVYLWGKRNCHPRTGSYAGWSVGGGAQGDALACGANYPNHANTWAMYGPFDLSQAGDVRWSSIPRPRASCPTCSPG